MKFYPKGYVPKYHQISMQIASANSQLDIPAGAISRNEGYYRFDKPVQITAIQAHMHNIGKRMCLEAILPTNTTLQLNCMGWDFNWHKVYNYADERQPAAAGRHSAARHACGTTIRRRTGRIRIHETGAATGSALSTRWVLRG